MGEPNILLIVSDQLRADCIGCYGNKLIMTPNIDRLADEGVLFSDAFTPLPSCCPARQAMLTGKRPEALGALWNYDIALKVMHIDPEKDPTWTVKLSEAGYNMGYVGKWHVSPKDSPIEFGFNEYVSERDYRDYCQSLDKKALSPATSTFYGRLNKFLGEEDPLPLEHTRTHYFAKKAANMIERYSKDYKEKGKPWHIRLDFPEPHIPCRPSGKYAKMYNSREIPKWGGFDDSFENKPYIQKQQLFTWGIDEFEWEDWAPIVARYYGIISQMDDAIGIVLKELENAGREVEENTIVILTSDHGDLQGSHRMIDKHYCLYDDITRVPMIIRWPARIANPGRREESFVYNCLDIPATMNEIMGWNEEDLHGVSLLDIILDSERTVSARNRSYVVSTFNGQQFGLYTSRMIRTRRWKYIWNTTDIDELYDMENDPYELNNLIKAIEHYGIIKDLREKLYNELASFGDGLVSRSGWLRDQLLYNRKMA